MPFIAKFAISEREFPCLPIVQLGVFPASSNQNQAGGKHSRLVGQFETRLAQGRSQCEFLRARIINLGGIRRAIPISSIRPACEQNTAVRQERSRVLVTSDVK